MALDRSVDASPLGVAAPRAPEISIRPLYPLASYLVSALLDSIMRTPFNLLLMRGARAEDQFFISLVFISLVFTAQ